MPMHSRTGWKVTAALVLVAGLLVGRAALSGKVADPAPAAQAQAPAAAVAVPAAQLGCDNQAALDNTHKVLNQIIEARRWTAKDHDRIAPLFYSLHTEQKVEILRKFSAAFDRIKIDKGARLF
jgi:hypothetical protein